MSDVVDAQTRSRMMSGIGPKDTKPEMILRRALHSMGFRFRLHDKRLPGKPDLVFPGRRAVVFVHGCFWHRHDDCRYAATPATRPEFWAAKFDGNVSRDARAREALLRAGWRFGVVWECGLRKYAAAESIAACAAWLRSDEPLFESETPSDAIRR